MTPAPDWEEAQPGDFAVIGDPVAHSLSPRMHSAAFVTLGLDWVYRAVRVAAEDLLPALEHLAALGYRGLNVTVPLKELAFSASTGGDARMGAVNTLRLAGPAQAPESTNTDAPGFLETLRDAGVGPCRVLMLGAGGSARALVVAMADEGYRVHVWNRTPERAAALVSAAGVAAEVVAEPDPSDCGLIVNATSAGLDGAAPPCQWDRAPSMALAYDLLYGPSPTPFLRAAADHGLRGVDGKAMLVAQGALSLRFWLDVEAPREAMMRAIA